MQVERYVGGISVDVYCESRISGAGGIAQFADLGEKEGCASWKIEGDRADDLLLNDGRVESAAVGECHS